jgi:hypothetical protein
MEAKKAEMTAALSERRCAINLNNCGVILLSRRLWSDAMETFRDAMRITKSIANEHGGAVSELEMQLLLDRAGQRTSIAFPKTPQDLQGLHIKVISSQCNPATLCSYFSCDCCLHDTKFLVTIDPIDFEGWDTEATELEAACILYNFGIATSLLCCARGCHFAHRCLCKDSSHRILQLAHTLAFQLFSKAFKKAHLCNFILLINMLVTHRLMYMSFFNNDPGASEEYWGSLNELAFLNKAHQKLLSVEDQKYAAAA